RAGRKCGCARTMCRENRRVGPCQLRHSGESTGLCPTRSSFGRSAQVDSMTGCATERREQPGCWSGSHRDRLVGGSGPEHGKATTAGSTMRNCFQEVDSAVLKYSKDQ